MRAGRRHASSKSAGTIEQYASKYLTRALDVLHVASALLLKTTEFASFDLRQRNLASAVGLKLLPVRLVP